jgi:TPR repeat protein
MPVPRWGAPASTLYAGEGAPQDRDEAVRLFQKARRWYALAAEKGVAGAEFFYQGPGVAPLRNSARSPIPTDNISPNMAWAPGSPEAAARPIQCIA